MLLVLVPNLVFHTQFNSFYCMLILKSFADIALRFYNARHFFIFYLIYAGKTLFYEFKMKTFRDENDPKNAMHDLRQIALERAWSSPSACKYVLESPYHNLP